MELHFINFNDLIFLREEILRKFCVFAEFLSKVDNEKRTWSLNMRIHTAKLTSTGKISRKLAWHFHISTNFRANNWISRNSKVVLKQSFQTAKQVPAQTLFQAKNTWRTRFQLHQAFVVFLSTTMPFYIVLTRRRIDKRWF